MMFFVISILLASIISRLLVLQAVKGDDYLAQSKSKLTNSIEVKAPRGQIYDRNGKPLITNRVGFSVQVNYSDMADSKLNDILLNLTSVFDKNGDDYVDTLPISADNFEYTFTEEGKVSAADKTAEFKKKYGISASEDGKAALRSFMKRYNIDDRYTAEQLRKIVGVRYELENRGLAYGSPVTVANDVSMETVSVLKENNDFYSNITVVTSPFREYTNGSLASHVLGRVGVIYREEYEQLKDQNYGMNDIIGKDGLEKFLEPYIKGKDGRINRSREIGTKSLAPDEVSAIPGNNAVLTIDSQLQKVAEDALKETITDIKKRGVSKKDKAGADAGGGAVVAMDVKTGEILAIASYPDFDPSSFDENYEKLIKDSGKPMFNRAISGTYPPGSVFKIITAIAGLEEKVITPSETIVDKGQYEYYGQTFNCWIWTQSHTTHGAQNVSKAIENSCNYYFYEVGRRLGEKKIFDYASRVGLGKKTGIEIEGESAGILANEEYKKETFDQVWYPGDTLQMAIGQSFNLFTPLQIVNYISTVANGGTCYRPHLTKSIRDYSEGKEVKIFSPEEIGRLDMSESTYKSVTEGMYLGSMQGTSSATFADFPIKVCSKTGSAQVNSGSANGVFATYAPYDDPQIAIAVVIENAGSGAALAPIARKIYEKYFGLNEEYDKADYVGKNVLLR